MNSIIRHIPSFVDTDHRHAAEFETTEQMLSIDWVKDFEELWDGMPFHRWSKQDDCLIVEHGGGRHWWVVGHIKNPSDVNLPEWKAPSE